MRKTRKGSLLYSMLLAASLGAQLAPMEVPKAVGSRPAIENRRRSIFGRNRGTGAGRKQLPKHIQDQRIIEAHNRREMRCIKQRRMASSRDLGYYRVTAGSNLHRFRPIPWLEAV